MQVQRWQLNFNRAERRFSAFFPYELAVLILRVLLQVVEFMLRKVMEEFERHLVNQRKQVTKVCL